tara:strand:+ start:375 stop:1508 length:1134 start_codon:yes stop_codon:yes gene_type:complete
MVTLIQSLNNSFDFKVALLRNGKHAKYLESLGIPYDIIKAAPLKYFYHNETGKIQLWYALKYIGIYRDWQRTVNTVGFEYLKKQKADIIHLNSHVLSSWAFVAKKIGFKVILHNRETVAKGYFGFRRRILQKLIKQNTDAIINISHDNKKRLGIERNSFVVYNFVEIPKKYKTPFLKNKETKVLYLGGQSKIKGFKTAVNTLKYISPGCKIMFAGNYGKYNIARNVSTIFKNLLKLLFFTSVYAPLRKMKKFKNFEMIGMFLDALPQIDSSDILIAPFKIEHFSRPAMEAMAYGKPVIASNVEGMDEIVDDGITGILVDKNNPKKLAKAINYLNQNPEIGIVMGQKGREKAIKLFSAKKNSIQVKDVYLKVLNINKS